MSKEENSNNSKIHLKINHGCFVPGLTKHQSRESKKLLANGISGHIENFRD
jgi:hypothetical protein